MSYCDLNERLAPGYRVKRCFAASNPKCCGARTYTENKFFVYILVCSDGSYYTGYTNDLEKRVKAHNCSKRGAKYTRAKRPVKVVWMREYTNKSQALKIEARIKNLTRVEKDNLVKNTVLEHI